MTRRYLCCFGAAFVLVTACASAHSAHPDPVAELEARVARLELLLAPDAGRLELDASPAGTDREGDAAAVILPVPEEPDASSIPSDRLAECTARAAQSCRARSAMRRVEGADGDAGLAWTRLDVPDDAAQTPEGRKCLRAEQVRCSHELGIERRQAALTSWLDGQLTPDRIDRKFSDRVEKLLGEKQRGWERAEVLCTSHFCRVRDPFDAGAGSAAWAVHASDPDAGLGGTESMRSGAGSYEYVTRAGYRFPE